MHVMESERPRFTVVEQITHKAIMKSERDKGAISIDVCTRRQRYDYSAYILNKTANYINTIKYHLIIL